MRRRHQLTVWPAVADLMTVLAVSGLFGCLALLPHAEAKGELVKEAQKAEEKIRDLKEKSKEDQQRIQDLEATLTALREAASRWEEQKQTYEGQLQEAAKNEQMFEAIQRAQSVVDQISADKSLRFEQDQTLRFGDDLVQFAPNSFLPTWKPEGRAKLREFCQKLSRRLTARTEDGADLRDLFTVQVEGHTDSTGCPGDPYCNWWISAARAALFVALMKGDDHCPGGATLNLQPVGYADTKAPELRASATKSERRRISLRLVPAYQSIIERTKTKSSKDG